MCFLPQVIQYIHTQTWQKWIELHRFHRETGRKKLVNIHMIKFYTAVKRKEEVCVGGNRLLGISFYNDNAFEIHQIYIYVYCFVPLLLFQFFLSLSSYLHFFCGRLSKHCLPLCSVSPNTCWSPLFINV